MGVREVGRGRPRVVAITVMVLVAGGVPAHSSAVAAPAAVAASSDVAVPGAGGAPGAAAAPGGQAVLTAVVCPAVAGAPAVSPSELSAAVTDLANRRLVTVVSEDGGACAAVRDLHRPSAGMPDLSLALTSLPDRDGPRARAWLGMQLRGNLTFKVLGRVFTGDLTDRVVALPLGREAALTTAIAEALAARAAPSAGRGDLAPEALRRRALDDLRASDDEALATDAPRVAAVVKELRGVLLLAGPCERDSPLDLFRAAARLAPDSADARTLVALARVKQAYEPDACTALAEGELQESLELEPWRDTAADNLGVLYELVSNARPPSPSSSGREISTTTATRRLDTIWKGAAPLPPRALELAAAVSFSSAIDKTTGALAPGSRVELGYGRDGSGWGARAGLSLLWTREVLFAADSSPHQGRVRWTRIAVDLGGRYRLVARPGTYAEAGAAVVVAPVYASGSGFDVNHTSWGMNLGGTAALRVGQRLGPVGLWIGLSGSYFFGNPSREVYADAAETTAPPAKAQLPALDVTALGGMSFFFWL